MSDANTAMKEMIIKNLVNNGFPMKKVSLPLEKLYEVADTKGANLNNVLKELKSEGTIHEKTAEKIIFSAAAPANMSQEDMMAQAQEMMGKMSPEEVQKIQDMVKNMSAEDQQKMMDQAKKMGML